MYTYKLVHLVFMLQRFLLEGSGKGLQDVCMLFAYIYI